jgi:hypothetical protein
MTALISSRAWAWRLRLEAHRTPGRLGDNRHLLGRTQRLWSGKAESCAVVAALKDRHGCGAEVGGIDECDRDVGKRVSDDVAGRELWQPT